MHESRKKSPRTRVLQCVAVRCTMLHCVALCCTVLQCNGQQLANIQEQLREMCMNHVKKKPRTRVLRFVLACYGVLCCVAACYGVLQYDAQFRQEKIVEACVKYVKRDLPMRYPYVKRNLESVCCRVLPCAAV